MLLLEVALMYTVYAAVFALSAFHNTIRDYFDETLYLKNVTILSNIYPALDDDKLIKILRNNPDVETIDLSLSYRRGVSNVIAQLKNLNVNAIGDEGCKAIAGLKKIQYVNLDYNNIGEAGFMALIKSPTIQHLDVQGNFQLTPTAIDKALPYATRYNYTIKNLHFDGSHDQRDASTALTKRNTLLPRNNFKDHGAHFDIDFIYKYNGF